VVRKERLSIGVVDRERAGRVGKTRRRISFED